MVRVIFPIIILITSSVVSSFPLICINELKALDKCHNEKEDCKDCKTLIGNFGSNPFSSGFCDAANDALCSVYGCCKDCKETYTNYEQCLKTATLFNCNNLGDDCATRKNNNNVLLSWEEQEEEELLSEELELQGCLSKFGNFVKCVTTKDSHSCNGCFVENNIPNDISEGRFCSTVTEAICGFATCCEPCTDEFIEFDECFERVVVDVTFGDCEIDCNFQIPMVDQQKQQQLPFDTAFEEDDVKDDLAAGIPAFEEDDGGLDDDSDCQNSLQDYATCIEDNALQCDDYICGSIIQNNAFCQAASDSLCGLGACCTPCETEFQEFEICLETVASTTSLDECVMDCSDNDNMVFGYRRSLLRGKFHELE